MTMSWSMGVHNWTGEQGVSGRRGGDTGDGSRAEQSVSESNRLSSAESSYCISRSVL